MRSVPVTGYIGANIGLEIFIFVSAFLGGYKLFQIMDAKNGVLDIKDILKWWARKFLRLAPMYYLMWIVLWGLTSRTDTGPLWHITN